MTIRPCTRSIVGIAATAALVSLAVPASAYFGGLGPWAGACAQSGGAAPGCGQIPVQRGPAVQRISPEEQQIEEQQREEQQQELDRLQHEREEAERRAQEARADDLAGQDAQSRGDLQGAIDKFLAALELAPGDTTIQAHLNSANIALAAEQSTVAIDALRQRIQTAMITARLAALRQDVQAKMLTRRLVAFYNSIVQEQKQSLASHTAPSSQQQSSGSCVAGSDCGDRAHGGQQNPGARTQEAGSLKEVKPQGANKAPSTKEALIKGGTTGLLFDGGRGPSDAPVDPRLQDVGTPQSASPALAAKLAKDKDYQQALHEMNMAQVTANILNGKLAVLEQQQKENPTSARQIDIANLSAHVGQAIGTLKIAQGKVEGIKKRIEEGAPIIIDGPASGPPAPHGDRKN